VTRRGASRGCKSGLECAVEISFAVNLDCRSPKKRLARANHIENENIPGSRGNEERKENVGRRKSRQSWPKRRKLVTMFTTAVDPKGTHFQAS